MKTSPINALVLAELKQLASNHPIPQIFGLGINVYLLRSLETKDQYVKFYTALHGFKRQLCYILVM